MPTFNLGKSIDDIVEPELMPKAWYPFAIYKEPTQEPNKIMRAMAKDELEEGMDPEKAGYNVVVDVRCIEESEHKGRVFRFYVNLPKAGDAEKTSPIDGQTYLDQYVTRNAKLARDFGGAVEGDQFSLALGGSGMLFVTQQMDLAGVKMVNAVDFFGAGSRPLAGAEEISEDDVPFD